MAHAQPTAPTVAVYIRSARPGAPSLIEARTAALRRYAQERGWTVSAVYAEVRPSGISDDTLEKLTGYDIVLVEEWSRLSRSLAGIVEVHRRLNAAAVRVVAVQSEGAGLAAGDGEATDLANRVLSVVTELERAAHSRRMKAGIAAARARRAERR